MAAYKLHNYWSIIGWGRFTLRCVLGLGALVLFSLLVVRTQVLEMQKLQALDSAKAIGAALQPYMHRNDVHSGNINSGDGIPAAPEWRHASNALIRDTLLSAIGQSGAYGQIILIDPDGNTLYEQRYVLADPGVPLWFQRLLPINPPIVQAEVLAGWDIAGTLSVSRHPAAGYQLVWRMALGLAGPGLIMLTTAIWLRRRRLQADAQIMEDWQRTQDLLQNRVYQLTAQLETHEERTLYEKEAAD
ncbi:LapD/MoxY N-terminal periplasmic domain-containing protein [Microbulbifer sp. ALW1]|uniref:LapD/MoxY N-terminal periplasmic domain-containing protein n=1 Tax=Microbulbifer sp. (strain ALW1) TaxID=1516059 RepID=UPI00135A3EB4|nr:LapD/MoxY N-terminal periplasmic domain-containing protein [Microbulbifer sp. ALW1]